MFQLHLKLLPVEMAFPAYYYEKGATKHTDEQVCETGRASLVSGAGGLQAERRIPLHEAVSGVA